MNDVFIKWFYFNLNIEFKEFFFMINVFGLRDFFIDIFVIFGMLWMVLLGGLIEMGSGVELVEMFEN